MNLKKIFRRSKGTTGSVKRPHPYTNLQHQLSTDYLSYCQVTSSNCAYKGTDVVLSDGTLLEDSICHHCLCMHFAFGYIELADAVKGIKDAEKEETESDTDIQDSN